MDLVTGTMYRVRKDHHFYAGKMGRFEFLGGRDRSAVVMSEVKEDVHRCENNLFAVDVRSLEEFDLNTDRVIEMESLRTYGVL